MLVERPSLRIRRDGSVWTADLVGFEDALRNTYETAFPGPAALLVAPSAGLREIVGRFVTLIPLGGNLWNCPGGVHALLDAAPTRSRPDVVIPADGAAVPSTIEAGPSGRARLTSTPEGYRRAYLPEEVHARALLRACLDEFLGINESVKRPAPELDDYGRKKKGLDAAAAKRGLDELTDRLWPHAAGEGITFNPFPFTLDYWLSLGEETDSLHLRMGDLGAGRKVRCLKLALDLDLAATLTGPVEVDGREFREAWRGVWIRRAGCAVGCLAAILIPIAVALLGWMRVSR